MILTNIKLENWMKIVQLSLQFKPGINLIYGPNEIGKSSIIEAIRMAISGDSASSSKEYKRFQPWGTKLKANVELTFDTNQGKNCRVNKSFPSGSSLLYAGNVPLADSPSKTNEKLFSLLGLTDKTKNLLDLLFIKQGEALNIFDKKKNPLDEETCSFIKDVIKETAFKSLQQFRDEIDFQWGNIFTASGQLIKGQKASEYKQYLDTEKKLRQQKTELEERIDELSSKLEEIETLDKQVEKLTQKKEENRSRFDLLKVKRGKLEDLEKKRLEFTPLEQSYKRFIDIDQQVSKFNRELPQLVDIRVRMLSNLEQEIDNLKARRVETLKRVEAMKLKKKEWEILEEQKRVFDELKKDFLSMKQLEKSMNDIESEMPGLYKLCIERLDESLKILQTQIDKFLKVQIDLKETQEKAARFPLMIESEIAKARKLSIEIQKIDSQLEAARAGFRMKFETTPLKAEPIPFNIRIDSGETVSYHTSEPVIKEGFRQLDFQYPSHFNIAVSGALAKIDIDSLEKSRALQKETLEKMFHTFQVAGIDELETRFKERSVLLNRGKELYAQIETMTPLEDLNKQRSEIESDRVALNLDIEKIHGMKSKIDQKTLQPLADKRSLKVLNDELIKKRTQKDSYALQLESILKGRTPGNLETLYTQREKEIRQMEESIKRMEPFDILNITSEMLTKLEKESVDLEKKEEARSADRVLLESIQIPYDFSSSTFPQNSGSSGFAGTPQQLWEQILEKRTRLQEFEKSRDQLLAGRKEEEFRLEYSTRKDEIEASLRLVAQMEPVLYGTLETVNREMESLEKEFGYIDSEKQAANSKKDLLRGELKGFGNLIEDKNRVDYEHQEVLEGIREQLVDIYAMKLLMKVIDEEKESAQQEVFKPLEERLRESLEKLIPGKYRPFIDNDLNVSVSAEVVGGRLEEGVTEALSLGMREQLSFLLRLAIAGQLSLKEPQVMILDDSFVNTDNQRLPRLIEMIEQHSQAIQFLIFTCRKDDYFKYKDRFHVIDIEEMM